MTQAHQWEEQAYIHLNAGVRLRRLAERRMSIMERHAEHVDRKYASASEDEDLDNYHYEISRVISPEAMSSIAGTLERSIGIERKVTAAHLHDINILSKAAFENGYRLVPRKDIGATQNANQGGISVDTVNAMREAIGAEILK